MGLHTGNHRFALSHVTILLLTLVVLMEPAVAAVRGSRCAALFVQKDVVQKEKPAPIVMDGPFAMTSLEIEGRVVFYEYLAAEQGKPTLLVFPGLLTPISDFTDFKESFCNVVGARV